LPELKRKLEKARSDIAPVPVPERHGEPSVFEHVVYIIKENRTYDQVFGDLPQGNGDPSLVHFGREVTPNHHALAETYTLFDNFYCSGVLSADGHQWTNEAYVTDYLERFFGDFTRSYPYDGDDPLAYASTGFIWDNVLRHGLTFRNYGEFVQAELDPPKAQFLDFYKDYLEGTHTIKMRARTELKRLEPYLCPTYVGFPNTVPDVIRVREFLKEFREFERQGSLPNFIILLLPNDHTSGTRPDRPTPRASVADNDLSLGQIVEAVSHSRFWEKTCIFVVQDDPQDGLDHVDSHRTVALVISPYTRRGFVDSTMYTQPGMLKTIELILGIPPMNQFDLLATPMRACFQNEPDFTPYKALKNNIPLD
ncbi:MAG TPA: alkaline phosphatase family protein, partial [bacterium]|nr:alkaline phosphatase family protein [bacterium]